MENISAVIIPFCMVIVGLCMIISKKDMFSEFTEGAKNGMIVSMKLLPTLVALICAISMFNASGAALFLADVLSPLCERIGVPSEIVPFILVRPLSGGASTAMLSDIYTNYGPDSFIGRCVSLISGSSDTLLYVISVYFGAVGVKKTRGTLPISVIIMVFCVFLSLILTKIFFRM